MKISIAIRKPKQDDFSQIYKLLTQLWSSQELNKATIKKVYLAGLKSNAQHYLVATTEDTTIVGFVSLYIKNSLWQSGNLAHIDELIVDNDYRGKGVGTLLLNKIIHVAQKKNCKRIELDSAHNRLEAHEFYKIKGFENRAHLFSLKIL